MTTEEVGSYVALANRLARISWVEIVHAGKPLDHAAIEKQLILAACGVCEDNPVKAARLLDIGKTTIYRRLKKYREVP
jgi:transcriptional regulator of acetoin/glycerol metabolism